LAPRGPKDMDAPDLLRFKDTPGAIFIRRKKRKAIVFAPVAQALDRHPGCYRITDPGRAVLRARMIPVPCPSPHLHFRATRRRSVWKSAASRRSSIAPLPPNPLGNFSTTSRWTTLPLLGTTRGTDRPRPMALQMRRRPIGRTSASSRDEQSQDRRDSWRHWAFPSCPHPVRPEVEMPPQPRQEPSPLPSPLDSSSLNVSTQETARSSDNLHYMGHRLILGYSQASDPLSAALSEQRGLRNDPWVGNDDHQERRCDAPCGLHKLSICSPANRSGCFARSAYKRDSES
jgi:hypothetical protein